MTTIDLHRLSNATNSSEICRTLVLKSAPADGEGLIDFLHRVLAINGFRNLSVLNALIGVFAKGAWSHYSLARRRIDPNSISQLTGADASHIEYLTYRKSGTLVEFFGTAISPMYLSNVRRVSPAFLREHGYQKAIWALRCFSFDPTNNERLLDCCPSCRVPLSFKHSIGPCYCSQCGFDLRDSPQEMVSELDTQAIDFVRYLIDPTLKSLIRSDLPDGLQQLSRGEIFAVVMTLGSLLQYQKNVGADERVLPKRIPFDLSPETLVEASNAVIDWSNLFDKTAEKVRAIRPHSRNKNHALVRAIPIAMSPLKKIVLRRIMKDSGSGKRDLHTFSGVGKISHFRYHYPRTVEADALRMGVPRAEIMQLYRFGYVCCPDPELRENLGLIDDFPHMYVPHFLEQVESARAGYALNDIVRSARPARHPWAAVINAAFKGDVKLTRTNHGGFLRSLYTQDFLKVRRICTADVPEVSRSVEITLPDATFYLAIGHRAITLLKRAGLLPDRILTIGDVWCFQEDFMTTGEIQAHLRIAGKKTSNQKLWYKIESVGLVRAVPDVGVLRRSDGDDFIRLCRSEGWLCDAFSR